MNKNYIIVSIIVILILLGGIGYSIWSGYNTDTKAPVITPVNTTNTNTVPEVQTNLPIVETNSNNAPYISTVVVNGTVNPNGALTTYWFEYGQTSSLGEKTVVYLVGSGYTKIYTPAYITGLNSNTNYYYKLTANNAIGTASGAIYSFKTNTTPAPDGIAPITNTDPASDITKTDVNLHGQVNPKNSETTYWFEYGLTSNLGIVTPFQSAGSGNSSSSVLASVSNLQPLTKYYFRLDAQNQFGTANGQILNFTTNGPVATTVPTVSTDSASDIKNSSAKLNANVNPNGFATTYWFEYSKNSLISSDSLIVSSPQQLLNNGTSAVNVSASIISLTNNTKYYVRVVATNQFGTVRGDIVSFTTKK